MVVCPRPVDFARRQVEIREQVVQLHNGSTPRSPGQIEHTAPSRRRAASSTPTGTVSGRGCSAARTKRTVHLDSRLAEALRLWRAVSRARHRSRSRSQHGLCFFPRRRERPPVRDRRGRKGRRGRGGARRPRTEEQRSSLRETVDWATIPPSVFELATRSQPLIFLRISTTRTATYLCGLFINLCCGGDLVPVYTVVG